MRLKVVLMLVAALALAGCAEAPSTVLVLHYTLTNVGGEHLGAEPGHHCGLAAVEGNSVELERKAYGRAGKPDPVLVVLPDLVGPWATTGDAAILGALPYAVAPFNDEAPIATIGWQEGQATVDGHAVELPYAWDKAEGNWTASFALERGPTKVRFWTAEPCE